MSNKSQSAPLSDLLLERVDLDELEHDIRQRRGAALTVVRIPPLEDDGAEARPRHISVPADDASMPVALAAAGSRGSWLALRHPVDVEAVVEHAFSDEVAGALAPEELEEAQEDEDEIPVDLDLGDGARADGEEAAPRVVSGELGAIQDEPAEAAVEPVEGSEGAAPTEAAVANSGLALRVAFDTIQEGEAEAEPAPAAGPEAPPPVPGAVAPPPVPGAAAGPPPVPGAATGEAPEIAGEGLDEAGFEAPDPTVVDEVAPATDADVAPAGAASPAASETTAGPEAAESDLDRTPPPIPLDAATPLHPRSEPGLAAASSGAEGAAPPPVPPVSRDRKRSKKVKKFRKPWYEEFFDDDYLATLPFMTPATTRKEATYVESHLKLTPGAKVLDIGCGYGRHAIELAQSGYEVTGLDTSLPLLIKAAEITRDAGVEVNFMHQDMREMSFEAEFDGAYCVMTSFGYFDDETNQDVVRRIFRSIKPGGRFLLEVINRDFILGDLPSRVWWEGEECVVMDEVEFNYLTSRIVSKRSVVFGDGRSINHDLSIRAYCLHELGRLLHNSGFKVTSVTGNMATENRFFGQYSPYLIILSQKPEEKQKA